MAAGRKGRGKECEISAEGFPPRQLLPVMGRGGDDQAVERRRRGKPSRNMHAVGADAPGEPDVCADDQPDPAGGADRFQLRGEPGPARHPVIAQDHRRAFRQDAGDEQRVRRAGRVGEESQMKRRIGARLAFERGRRRC